jgi:hypothetical protein
MYISKTILIIIIFIISILASQKILETFVFLDVNSLDKVLINPNITKYSIILPNNMHKMKRVDALKNNLCKNNELMINMIKYSEGTEWSKWLTCDDKTISEYAKKIYYYINNKSNKGLFITMLKNIDIVSIKNIIYYLIQNMYYIKIMLQAQIISKFYV